MAEYTLTYKDVDESSTIVTGISPKIGQKISVIISETYRGRTVIGIGDFAFYACESLASIEIPNSVTSIGSHAFEGCPSLTSVTIGNGVTSIGDNAFENCMSLTSITIPDSVTLIGFYAFHNCKKLSNVALGEGVKEIETGAFRRCESLTEIKIPKSVEMIGVYAFGESGLRTTTVEQDLSTNCFWYCINESNEQIKMSCLIQDISGSVLSTGFCRNYKLEREKYKEGSISKLTYNKIEGIEEYEIIGVEEEGEIILVPEKYENCPVTRIAEDAFRIFEENKDKEKATSIIIAAKVKEIGNWAFGQRKKINSIILNYGLKTLGNSVFFGCTKLFSIFFPPTIEEIGTQLFYWDTSLAKIVVHEDNKKYSSVNNCLLNTDETELIYGCQTSIIPKSVTIIGQGAFYGQNYKQTEFKIPNSVTKIETLGIGFQNVSDIYLPHSLETIHKDAFYNCRGLKNIYYNVKNAKLVDINNSPIEHSPFCLSDEMTPPNGINIYIGGSVEAIPPYMFKCNKHTGEKINFRINSINIGWGIEEIADDVFGDMVEPREVLLPSSVTKIGANSFSKDVTLKQDKKYAEDFIGFTYNGYHSIRDLNIYRTSDGSRYNENLTATMTDKTADVPGGDGQYYFGTQFKNRTFNVSYAFDSLSENGLARLKEVFRGDGVHDLIFDETPYKVWSAKVTGTAQIKHICFEENGERRYKGEGSITFTCYYPYAHTPTLSGPVIAESVDMIPVDRDIITSIFVPKGWSIRNESGAKIETIYQEQVGDVWENEIVKNFDPRKNTESGDVVSTTNNTLITKIKFLSQPTSNRIILLPDNTYSSSCAFSYVSNGYIEHTSALDGRDINSYLLSEYTNKNEWMISSNLSTQTYNNLDLKIGAINRGQLPAPFKLTTPEITFIEDNPDTKDNENAITMQVGDNIITITANPGTYKNFVWDSKTGIVKAKDASDKTIYFSYTGDSVGTIPVNTAGIAISYPGTMTLDYQYWYL